MLGHINRRVKDHKHIQLPVEDLLAQFSAPNSSAFVMVCYMSDVGLCLNEIVAASWMACYNLNVLRKFLPQFYYSFSLYQCTMFIIISKSSSLSCQMISYFSMYFNCYS